MIDVDAFQGRELEHCVESTTKQCLRGRDCQFPKRVALEEVSDALCFSKFVDFEVLEDVEMAGEVELRRMRIRMVRVGRLADSEACRRRRA